MLATLKNVMGKDNRVRLDEFDEEDLDLSSKDKKAAKVRAELEKKQREKRQKNIESKNKHQTGELE